MKTYDLSSAEQLLQTNETASFLTAGASMRPLLRAHKDIVVIARPKHPLKIGEVPLYKKEGVQKLILHRIIDVLPDGTYVTRGDNTYHKEFIPKDDVVGVLTSIYRGGKYIDCNTSKKYKTYVFFNRFFYPIRFVWHVKIRPILSKVKHKFFQ